MTKLDETWTDRWQDNRNEENLMKTQEQTPKGKGKNNGKNTDPAAGVKPGKPDGDVISIETVKAAVAAQAEPTTPDPGDVPLRVDAPIPAPAPVLADGSAFDPETGEVKDETPAAPGGLLKDIFGNEIPRNLVEGDDAYKMRVGGIRKKQSVAKEREEWAKLSDKGKAMRRIGGCIPRLKSLLELVGQKENPEVFAALGLSLDSIEKAEALVRAADESTFKIADDAPSVPKKKIAEGDLVKFTDKGLELEAEDETEAAFLRSAEIKVTRVHVNKTVTRFNLEWSDASGAVVRKRGVLSQHVVPA